MYQGYQVGAVLLMGGEGTRFGGSIPKQFCLLKGKPIYQYALETFLELNLFDEMVLVCHRDWIEKIERVDGVRLTKGGLTRQESSRVGLEGFTQRPEIVVVHDAVRPFVRKETILMNLDAAIACGAANTCIPTTDTLIFTSGKKWVESIPKREEFLRGQTPQTFRYDLIVSAHREAREKGIENVSDDCRLILDCGAKIAIVQGTEENFKITSGFDLGVADALLAIGFPNRSQKYQSEEKIENQKQKSALISRDAEDSSAIY